MLAMHVFQWRLSQSSGCGRPACDAPASHAGGAWGTALAMHASLRHDTVVYARETEVVEAINDPSIRENTTFLKVCKSLPMHLVSSLPGVPFMQSSTGTLLRANSVVWIVYT